MVDRSPAALVAVWERGANLPPAERGRALLGLDSVSAEPDGWTLGRRDAVLARILATLFGGSVEATVRCGACATLLEFATTVGALFGSHAEAEPETIGENEPPAFRLECDGYQLLLRPIRVADVSGLPASAAHARERVLRRCVIEAQRDGRAADVARLPPEVRAAISSALCAADPLGDILITLACPGCGAENCVPFDSGTFLWEALERSVAQTFVDVHVLASAYGWSERDILALPEHRRRRYLELVAG